MIRVLQVVNTMNRAGLETMLMNYYRHIDKTKIQFDFLTHRPDKGDYDNEIEGLGGKVYYAPRLYPQNYPVYFKWMKKFFVEHPEYRMIHSHIDAMSYIPLRVAKENGVPVRIAHSHSTSIDKNLKYILKQYYRSKINSVCNIRLACGEEAGKFLFGNNQFSIIPNAIDAKKFIFNKAIREKKRKELGISDEFVIGHVGRFCYPKNHEFLIDVFYELLKICPKSMLVLVGSGEKRDEILKKVISLGLMDKVLFLGNRSDVYEIYQIMDVFVMPSLFEGVPLVGIEAQFADLPCVFSDRVPKEVKFNDKSEFLPLNDKPEEWAKAIANQRNSVCRCDCRDLNSRYDIASSKNILSTLYIELGDKYDNE